MRRFRAALALLTFFAWGMGLGAADKNLLIITVDTLRTDRLSCYSPRFVKTPSVDGLAAGGVLFERAYAHCSTTLPSHTNIMTGMTPLYHGVHENSKAKVPGDCLTMAEHLKAQGYATAAFIAAFPLNARFGLDQGFDVYDDRLPYRPPQLGAFSERRAEDLVAAAMAWISGQQGPWFCWIHLWDPHVPYAPPEPFLTQYRNDPYSGEAAYVDAQLGVLFGRLQAEQQMGKTFIVLTADHGESLGEHGELTHGYFAYNSTIHVPLIMAGPGLRSLRTAGDVCHTDIFPTVCELLGVATPPKLQGRSLMTLMRGGRLKDRPIYFESLEPYLNEGVAPLRGIIEGGMKYMDSPVPEAYDMTADFEEKENVAGKTNLGPFRKKLDGLVKSYASSLPSGGRKVVDRQTAERLRSLGYVTSPVAQVKSSYGPEDDLKNFLPYQQKLDRAILLVDRGEMGESVRLMTGLTEEKPSFVPAFIYLSQVLRGQGRLPDAVRALEEGVRANPDDYTLMSALGTMLLQGQQWDRAIEVLEKARGIIDYDPDVWDNLGVAYMMKDQFPKALQYLEKGIALDGTFAPALASIGAVRQSMYFSQGRQPEDLSLSIEFFQKALAMAPKLDAAWRGLGLSLRTAGRNDEAIDAWEKAAALNPGDDYSIYHLGILYLDRGDKARALQNFEKYLKIKGDRISPKDKEDVDNLIGQCKK